MEKSFSYSSETYPTFRKSKNILFSAHLKDSVDGERNYQGRKKICVWLVFVNENHIKGNGELNKKGFRVVDYAPFKEQRRNKTNYLSRPSKEEEEP